VYQTLSYFGPVIPGTGEVEAGELPVLAKLSRRPYLKNELKEKGLRA
jgi:hypothetical protein